MTRRGIERMRVLVFVEMMKNGATKDEAFDYIDLIHPFEEAE